MNIYHRFLGAAVGPPFFCSRELVVSLCCDIIFQTRICVDDVAGEYKNSVYPRQKNCFVGCMGFVHFLSP